MNPARKTKSKIAAGINMVAVYLMSGALIMYGGINLSHNSIEVYTGLYNKGQWTIAIPFLIIFGIVPVIAGIMLLVNHPATATKKPTSQSTPTKPS